MYLVALGYPWVTLVNLGYPWFSSLALLRCIVFLHATLCADAAGGASWRMDSRHIRQGRHVSPRSVARGRVTAPKSPESAHRNGGTADGMVPDIPMDIP